LGLLLAGNGKYVKDGSLSKNITQSQPLLLGLEIKIQGKERISEHKIANGKQRLFAAKPSDLVCNITATFSVLDVFFNGRLSLALS
jgi:hypothetical protein